MQAPCLHVCNKMSFAQYAHSHNTVPFLCLYRFGVFLPPLSAMQASWTTGFSYVYLHRQGLIGLEKRRTTVSLVPSIGHYATAIHCRRVLINDNSAKKRIRSFFFLL